MRSSRILRAMVAVGISILSRERAKMDPCEPALAMLLFIKPEILPNMLGQVIIDLAVARHGLLLASGRIDVDVMASAMTQQDATSLRQLPDQLSALQSAISLVL